MQETTPSEAKRLMDEEGFTYLDVRTAEEFRAGHPAGAVNVPAFLKSPVGMQPNPTFLDVVRKHFRSDAKLVVGCLAGGRSAQACGLLDRSGFVNMRNVAGGFGGGRSAATGEPVPGWQQCGLPVETGGDPLS